MAVAASSNGPLLLRVDPARTDELIRDPAADRFQMGGREMNGWLGIDPTGLDTEADLARWVVIGLDFARSLPPK